MRKSQSRRSPKQARSQERYDEILKTAAHLFLKKGFDGTTTNEIAQEADMSVGALYQYFENKAAIVAALTDGYLESLKRLTADVVGVPAESLSTSDAVDRLLDPIVEFHLGHPEFRRLWLAAEVTPELKDVMKSLDEEVLARVKYLAKARLPGIGSQQLDVMVNTIALTVKALLGLLGRAQEPTFKALAATEAKRMIVAYVDDVVRCHKNA